MKKLSLFFVAMCILLSATVAQVSVSTLSELRTLAPNFNGGINLGTTLYIFTGQAVVTQKQSYQNVKYIQEGDVAIMIFDSQGNLQPNIEVGDKITNITGTLTNYYGMLEFIPIGPCDIIAYNSQVFNTVITASQLDYDHNNPIQAKVVTLENVMFVQTGYFEPGKYYDIKQNNIVYNAVVYTDKYDADYIGQTIPIGLTNIRGVVNFKGSTSLSQRNRIVPLDNYNNVIMTSPEITTLPATNITQSTATLNGTISADEILTQQGFLLYKDGVIDTIFAYIQGNNISYNLSGLTLNTTYQYKAFAIAYNQTLYGEYVTFTTQYFNQDGTAFLIENQEDLIMLANFVNGGESYNGQEFILTNDIVLPENMPNNILSIGTKETNRPFCGIFNGNNKRIFNVYIDHPNTPYQGLFGYIKDGSISNLGLVNITASGRDYTGGMIGYAENAKITDCYVSGGTLYALSYCGGLIGYQTPGTNSIITRCGNYGTAVTGNHYVGGLLGYSNQGTVRNSYVAASVIGQGNAIGAVIGGALNVLYYLCWFNSDFNCPDVAIGENIFKGDEGSMTSEEMRKPEFVNLLNQNLATPAWKMDYNPPINNGFPILIWQPQSTGIVNLGTESIIDLYPNPVRDNFTINLENETKGQVSIYDILGKVVTSQEINGKSITINISHLLKGVYNVRITADWKTISVSKIVKQ